MISFSGIKNILWDFDGVILDSMFWRQHGFSAILNNYPSDKVDILLDYHRTNGGLSRYHKLRYFFEEIMCQPVSDAQIQTLANAFSDIMRVKLTDPGLLIKDCLSYIDANYHYYCMHIVSGSDQDELRYLCDKLNISHYFHSIYGSPTSKVDNVSNLLEKYSYNITETILIGDSINDSEAAQINNITFYGYNNENIRSLFPDFYIQNLC